MDELIAKEGSPSSMTESKIDEKSTMYHYEDKSFQVKDDLVHMKFQKPKGREVSIQYWRHLYKDDDFKINVYEQTEHTKSYKLINTKKGVTLVFDESGRVLRVAKDLEVKGE